MRDFKPQNVLVTSDGKVTIVDMDSVQISVGNKLLYRATAHTPDYVPPEFYNLGVGKKEYHIISQSWDMFAVGVVFYSELISCRSSVVILRSYNRIFYLMLKLFSEIIELESY